MLELVSIVATATPNGHTFVAKLRDGGEDYHAQIGVNELRSYSYFQSHVLCVTGKMYWSANFENRMMETADSEWRAHVALLLERSATATGNGAEKKRNQAVN